MKNMKAAEIVGSNPRTVQTGRFSPGIFKTAALVTTIMAFSLASGNAFSQKTSEAPKGSKPEMENRMDTLGYIACKRAYLQIGQEIAGEFALYTGESFTIGIRLNDLSISTGKDNVHTAIIDIIDKKTGKVLKKMQVAPGEGLSLIHI